MGRTHAPRFFSTPGEMIALQTAHRHGATTSFAGFAAPPPFDVEVRPSRARAVVAPSGELDCATVDRLDAAVDDLVAAGWDSIVLDLRGLSFMDSTGLRAMVRQANRTDATVEFIDGDPRVARLFDLTGVRQLLSFIHPHDLHR
jgi:anti-sigma B factor antagonist